MPMSLFTKIQIGAAREKVPEGACTATGQTEVTYPLFCYVFNDSPVHAAPPTCEGGEKGVCPGVGLADG